MAHSNGCGNHAEEENDARSDCTALHDSDYSDDDDGVWGSGNDPSDLEHHDLPLPAAPLSSQRAEVRANVLEVDASTTPPPEQQRMQSWKAFVLERWLREQTVENVMPQQRG
mmetsp:Transcript_34057/g.79766  ORF Transcript_34057/g.79766 Transcript_34057/m.79766 type:complete len:112 (-) Transcript_34057:247-582(-)